MLSPPKAGLAWSPSCTKLNENTVRILCSVRVVTELGVLYVRGLGAESQHCKTKQGLLANTCNPSTLEPKAEEMKL